MILVGVWSTYILLGREVCDTSEGVERVTLVRV